MVIRYMLDTDACIALIKNRPEAMRSRLDRLSPEEVGISSIVAAELWFGVAHSLKKKQNEAALKDFLDYATAVDWPCEASPLYGKIRTGLQKQRTPIGAMDLLIAVHALFLGAVLITNNTREFERVPHLEIENWDAMGSG
ncbi:MAG: type II toxin-antitoxin system VapC family toxin [Desulfobacterales bacterium]|nr:type II toxin-antitoxin system VapC family toxin [Desulfobacterales bacterium]